MQRGHQPRLALAASARQSSVVLDRAVVVVERVEHVAPRTNTMATMTAAIAGDEQAVLNGRGALVVAGVERVRTYWI